MLSKNKSSSQSPSARARSHAARNRSPSIKDSSRAESKNQSSLRRQTLINQYRESVEPLPPAKPRGRPPLGRGRGAVAAGAIASKEPKVTRGRGRAKLDDKKTEQINTVPSISVTVKSTNKLNEYTEHLNQYPYTYMPVGEIDGEIDLKKASPGDSITFKKSINGEEVMIQAVLNNTLVIQMPDDSCLGDKRYSSAATLINSSSIISPVYNPSTSAAS